MRSPDAKGIPYRSDIFPDSDTLAAEWQIDSSFFSPHAVHETGILYDDYTIKCMFLPVSFTLKRDSADERGKSYLRMEFLKCIESEPIVYKLQIQFKHGFKDDADDVDWNAQTVMF